MYKIHRSRSFDRLKFLSRQFSLLFKVTELHYLAFILFMKGGSILLAIGDSYKKFGLEYFLCKGNGRLDSSVNMLAVFRQLINRRFFALCIKR